MDELPEPQPTPEPTPEPGDEPGGYGGAPDTTTPGDASAPQGTSDVTGSKSPLARTGASSIALLLVASAALTTLGASAVYVRRRTRQ